MTFKALIILPFAVLAGTAQAQGLGSWGSFSSPNITGVQAGANYYRYDEGMYTQERALMYFFFGIDLGGPLSAQFGANTEGQRFKGGGFSNANHSASVEGLLAYDLTDDLSIAISGRHTEYSWRDESVQSVGIHALYNKDALRLEGAYIVPNDLEEKHVIGEIRYDYGNDLTFRANYTRFFPDVGDQAYEAYTGASYTFNDQDYYAFVGAYAQGSENPAASTYRQFEAGIGRYFNNEVDARAVITRDSNDNTGFGLFIKWDLQDLIEEDFYNVHVDRSF
jgi:hypothetical protein